MAGHSAAWCPKLLNSNHLKSWTSEVSEQSSSTQALPLLSPTHTSSSKRSSSVTEKIFCRWSMWGRADPSRFWGSFCAFQNTGNSLRTWSRGIRETYWVTISTILSTILGIHMIGRVTLLSFSWSLVSNGKHRWTHAFYIWRPLPRKSFQASRNRVGMIGLFKDAASTCLQLIIILRKTKEGIHKLKLEKWIGFWFRGEQKYPKPLPEGTTILPANWMTRSLGLTKNNHSWS